MRKRVIIVGGGMSGLLTAYTMQKYKDVDVTVIEHREVGGHFLYGGYKYVRRTDEFISMLHDLECVFSTYSVNGGILLRGDVLRYPADFSDLDNSDIERIRQEYWEKTRKTIPGKHTAKAFADPFSYRTVRAVRADFQDVIEKLEDRIDIRHCAFIKQEDKSIFTTSGRMHFDYLVFTIPLNAMKDRVQYYVPNAITTKMSVVEVLPRRDPYYRFDYVYTPFTPENHVHRISSNGHTYFAEISGDIDETKVYSDLNFLFDGGWSPVSGKKDLRGHLMPIDATPDFPPWIATVGRYAQWSPRLTIDAAMDEAIRIGGEWFGEQEFNDEIY